MKLRVARHSTNLKAVKDFYHGILGLEIMGTFESHENYSGLFLGIKDQNWHLEFTISDAKPTHQADEDDLLVFYCDSQDHFEELVQKFEANNIKPVKPKNSYWSENAATYIDPDGFRIVISSKEGR